LSTPILDRVELPPEIDILVEAGDWPSEADLRLLVGRALAAAIAAALPPLAPSAELSLVFTDDAHSKSLNQRYRGKDNATNVLSFPVAQHSRQAFGPLLGDIVFAHGVIAREAADGKVEFDHHLTHLVVHGFLHLLGHHHENDGEAAVMEKLETAILADLGVADPYGGGAG
jgi:probable rRNA maturation factor